jgi:hypothetical protein
MKSGPPTHERGGHVAGHVVPTVYRKPERKWGREPYRGGGSVGRRLDPTSDELDDDVGVRGPRGLLGRRSVGTGEASQNLALEGVVVRAQIAAAPP